MLNTTLIKWDGSRVLYPNYKMNTDMITNITRSYNKGETFAVLVDMGTPLSMYEEVEKHIKLWSEPCPDINAVAVVPGNGGNPLKFTLTVWWEYTFNSKLLASRICCLLGAPRNDCLMAPAFLFVLKRWPPPTCLSVLHASGHFMANTTLSWAVCM